MPPIDETLAVGDPGHVNHHQALAAAVNALPTTVLETLSDVVEDSDSLNEAITAAIAARVAGEGFAPESHSHLTPQPSVEGVTGLVDALAAKLDTDDASSTYATKDELADAGSIIESVNTVAAAGATETLPDVTTATIHRLTLDANCTVAFPALGAGKSFTLILTQDLTGSRTVTWPATVRWDGDAEPALTTTPNRSDVLSFLCDGTYWLGFVGGQGLRVSPPTAPAQVTGLVATSGDGEVVLSWTAPYNGDSAITDYIVQYRTTVGPGTWTTFADGTSTTAAATVTGLTNDTSYDFRVAAVNAIGTGTYSATSTAVPGIPTLAADNFNRADNPTSLGTTSSGAKTWTASNGTGTLGISGNKAVILTTGGRRQSFDCEAVNYTYQVTVTHQGVSNLVLRFSTAAGSAVLVQLTNTDRRIATFTSGGIYTILASNAGTYVNGVDYIVKVVANGNVITLFVNGVQVLTHTLAGSDATTYGTAATTATRVGISGDDVGLAFDALSVV